MSAGRRTPPPGAGYGVRDWLAQRITAVVLLVGLAAAFLAVLMAGGLDYPAWSAVFASQPARILAELVGLALCWHAWIGVRDIWMDYVKPPGLRLALHVGTIVWLAYCLVWLAHILWSI
jgi:succinate dehydrogenase / fumarate reductase membrane anchor subunit